MTVLALLLLVLAAAYAVTGLMIWRTYRRNYSHQVSSPDTPPDDS